MTDVMLREAGESDRDAILGLRRAAFQDEDREKQRSDFWSWQFAGAAGGPARIFVAETNGAVVAHIAFVPQRYAAPEAVQGALAVDAMTHPDYRHRHIFSRLTTHAAAELRSQFDVITAFQIRPAVLPGMQAGGWHIVDECPVLVRPLSVLRLSADILRRKRAFDRRAGASSREEVRALGPADLDRIDGLVATGEAVRQPRSRTFLEWRFLENPVWRYDLEGWFERGELRAFTIHRPVVLRGVRALAIADAGGSQIHLRLLLRDIIDRARDGGASVAAALVSDAHPTVTAFHETGFRRGPHRFRLLAQAAASHLDRRRWSMMWGDTDHL